MFNLVTDISARIFSSKRRKVMLRKFKQKQKKLLRSSTLKLTLHLPLILKSIVRRSVEIFNNFKAFKFGYKKPVIKKTVLKKIFKRISFNKFRKLNFRLKLSTYAKISILILFGLFIASVIPFYLFILKDLPSPKNLTGSAYAVSTEIYDRHGTLLYEIYADQNRTPVKLDQIPKDVINATIAIEDKDFYQHQGLAISGVIRAAYKTLIKKDKQGGSTITQQLVKTALLTPERTIERKIKELVLAVAVEIIYPKDQILELYLNHIPYGGTAYGIEQASRLYFNKSASKLTLAEASLLAGLPQAPSLYSPFGSSPELARQRQKQVLERMVEEKFISEDQAKNAYNSVLTYALQHTNIKAPHFVMYVKNLLIEKYGTKKVEQGGLRVITTLDLPIQEYAQASVSAQVAKLKSSRVTNGAALVTKPATGEILAMVGSRDYFDSEIDGNVNLTTSLRQPGSSIKPLNYALGLSKGYPASMMFLDMPTCFSTSGQPGAYCPKNYDGSFHGMVQMRQALANSYNIPAVKMLALNGLTDFIATASAMGISTFKDPRQYGLSLTLGGGEVKMIDMATAFGVFANSGIKIDLNPILRVKTYTGEILEENNYQLNPPTGPRILSPEVTFIISNILSDNKARTPAFGARSPLYIPGKTVSVKTGTTDDWRDNWTIGYTPEFLTAVWTGNNNNEVKPLFVSGVTGAAPIWNSIMSYLIKDRDDVAQSKPDNVIGTNVCSYKPSEDNTQTCEGRFEYFIKGTEKNQIRGKIEKKNSWIDLTTGRPPLPGVTENLELQEKTMVTDEFGLEYCLDCPREGESAQNINLDKFYEKRNSLKVTN